MKLLLDQGLPRSASALLSEAGVDAVHVGDLGLSAADDHEILESSRNLQRVVATLDADFPAILAMNGATEPSVIRIRLEGLRGPALTDLLMSVIDRCSADLERGAVETVEPRRIRIRRLPILQ